MTTNLETAPEARGLPFKEPVPVEVVGKEAVRRHVLDRIDELGQEDELRAMGRAWWCDCGSWRPIATDIWSMHNSQHLIDPYTPSHVLHGLIEYD